MKRVGNLYAKVICIENLLLAAFKALRRKRHKISAASFNYNLEHEIVSLHGELQNGAYRPSPYRMFEIREPKVRNICCSAFRDRVVHHAICNLLEPLFERRFISDTYACRVRKGTHKALKRVHIFSRKYPYFLKCDIQKFFENIDHNVLKRLLSQMIKDKKLLSLLDIIINHAVPGNQLGKGLPIGNLTSQHFANTYLGELDHFLKDRLRVGGYVRYMDDFICFSESKKVLREVLDEIQKFLEAKLKLRLKEKITTLGPTTEGVSFLGFRVFPNLIRLQRSNLVRFRKKVKSKEANYMKCEISEEELTASVSSMIAHISHANTLALRRKEIVSP